MIFFFTFAASHLLDEKAGPSPGICFPEAVAAARLILPMSFSLHPGLHVVCIDPETWKN